MTKNISGLYVIIDAGAVGKRSLMDVTKQVLEGGATIVQYRDKDADSKDFYVTAKALFKLVKEHKRLFIINDRLDIARAVDADGVHVGQEIPPVLCAERAGAQEDHRRVHPQLEAGHPIS